MDKFAHHNILFIHRPFRRQVSILNIFHCPGLCWSEQREKKNRRQRARKLNAGFVGVFVDKEHEETGLASLRSKRKPFRSTVDFSFRKQDEKFLGVRHCFGRKKGPHTGSRRARERKRDSSITSSTDPDAREPTARTVWAFCERRRTKANFLGRPDLAGPRSAAITLADNDRQGRGYTYGVTPRLKLNTRTH